MHTNLMTHAREALQQVQLTCFRQDDDAQERQLDCNYCGGAHDKHKSITVQQVGLNIEPMHLSDA